MLKHFAIGDMVQVNLQGSHLNGCTGVIVGSEYDVRIDNNGEVYGIHPDALKAIEPAEYQPALGDIVKCKDNHDTRRAGCAGHICQVQSMAGGLIRDDKGRPLLTVYTEIKVTSITAGAARVHFPQIKLLTTDVEL